MKHSKTDMVCVAAITGAFGVSGEVKLKSFTQIPQDCLAYGPLYDEDGRLCLTLKTHRVMAQHIAVSAQEVQSREDAQALKGTQLYVPRSALPAPEDEDDFYYSDLIGLEVKTRQGQRMGRVTAVYEFGAGDMLEIQPDAKAAKKAGTSTASFFHPFTKRAVPKVDIGAGRIIIEIIEPENGRDPNGAVNRQDDLDEGLET